MPQRRFPWACCALVVGLAGLCWQSHRFVDAQLRSYQYSSVLLGVLWWADREVQAGRPRPEHGQYVQADWITYLQAYASNFLMLVGHVYVHPLMRTSDRLDVLSGRLPQDPEARFCRQLVDYRWLHPHVFGDVWPQVRATHSDIRDFVESCRRELPSIRAEPYYHLIEPWLASGHIPSEHLVHPVDNLEDGGRKARSAPLPPYPREELPAAALEAVVSESMAASTWGGLLDEPPEAVIEYYRRLDLRSLRTVPPDWQEVAGAIRRGEIVRFDARPLFPAWLFDVSIEELAQAEGGAADAAPVLFNHCRPTSLREFGERRAEEVRRGALNSCSLANSLCVNFENFAVDESFLRYADSVSGFRLNPSRCASGYINSRRLGRLWAGLPDVAGAMGMQGDVLRNESYLWMGPLRGGFHYDEEPNIYVQLAGESDVFLVPPQYVDAFTNGTREGHLPTRWELDHDPVMRRIPIHLLRLRPGDALSFPGGTFHLFMAQSFRRLALNVFFIPGWRRLEHGAGEWYAKEAGSPGGPERLALRQAWARSFSRLYDETGKGIFFMGEKLEYI